MRKIKVLRIINRFNIGGPTYNATFLTAFLGEGYETMLIGGIPDVGESDSLYILDEYGVKPILLEEMIRQPNISSDRRAYNKLKKIIRDFQPDIVHTHASKAGALGRKAAISCDVPILVHTYHGHVFHSYFGKTKTKLIKLIERRLAKRTDAIVAISEIQKKELADLHMICKKDKISVIPLGFDLESFHDKSVTDRKSTREKYAIQEDEIAIAIIGRLAPIKNHQYFLNVMETVLSKTSKKIKCFIVGDGHERNSIEEVVDKINAKHNNNIVFTSWISDIGSFNSGMDIICLTSKNEGTPVSLIEAQAGGIPVITTDVGGVRDVVSDGETGFVVPIEDMNLFIEKVLLLTDDEEKRKKMSQNGWNYVREKFDYRTLVKNMDHLYRDLIEKNRNEKY